jgi:hypothetical protein
VIFSREAIRKEGYDRKKDQKTGKKKVKDKVEKWSR